ncbi:MAG: bifunctional folylpolyglutamate synthase/dihydrofolate synthase [Spirosomataceae bacterium]
MTYQETIDYLYAHLPVFHRIGSKAFKPKLENTQRLCEHLGNPHLKFKSIHIAGTNGKGSSSHYLAAILQAAGYKTGLYTSPHLKSFTERIRINGQAIPESRVVKYVEDNKSFIADLEPSFFECTVGLAFEYFAEQEVDIAIIEVGLGGRLDSTNVIYPEVSLITNISYDHVDILGDTLPKIAYQKAGIIKQDTPVVISQRHPETISVFMEEATLQNAPIYFAEDSFYVENSIFQSGGLQLSVNDRSSGVTINLTSELTGSYQKHNLQGVLEVIRVLNSMGNFTISNEAVTVGISQVVTLTNLKGRWQQLSQAPLTICDTGHNSAGIKELLSDLESIPKKSLWLVLGFVKDKDISGILDLLPKEANYIFCQAQIMRALPADELASLALSKGLKGISIADVNQAIAFARQKANKDDVIFIGGSTFVVAEINEL